MSELHDTEEIVKLLIKNGTNLNDYKEIVGKEADVGDNSSSFVPRAKRVRE